MADQKLIDRAFEIGWVETLKEFWKRHPLREEEKNGPDVDVMIFSVPDLSHGDLRDADFSSADLNMANLTGANLAYADFTNANVLGMRFREANLWGARGLPLELRERYLTFLKESWEEADEPLD